MQERYLGDSHDFVKYALLRYLRRELGLCLGVNWYLTDPAKVDPPKNEEHGNKRHHLKNGAWASLDQDLWNRIKKFNDPAERNLKNMNKDEILSKDTLYFAEEVSRVDRSGWHNRGLEALSQAGIVFLDPDNGFEVKSATGKRLSKYSRYDEAVAYYQKGKIVVAIQFARQCCPIKKARDVRAALYGRAEYQASLPVLRVRLAPNILFVFLAPPEQTNGLKRVLEEFVKKNNVTYGGQSKLEIVD